MALAFRMTQPGGPDVLLTEPVQTKELAPHEARIVQDGVNYLDAMQRQGTAPAPYPGAYSCTRRVYSLPKTSTATG